MKLERMALYLLCAGMVAACDANTMRATAQSADTEPTGSANAALDLARCEACHQGVLSLNKFPPAELVRRIEQLRDAPGDHPPVQLEHASGADIEALADGLAAP